MLNFTLKQDESGQGYLETDLAGKPLLTTPQLNKGTAFTYEERIEFNLLGKLPARVETLDEQVARAYQQFKAYDNKLQGNIYLNNLHDKNQVVFYKLVTQHLEEMLPTIYTPIVGAAVKKFSLEYRQPRGLYISYEDKDRIGEILDNRSNPIIDLIVCTDGEGILGIGDQGVGGMDIPVAKLMVYSLCGGIDPTRTLPVHLDVGTNNQELLNDPFYLGWRHKRVEGPDYDDFIAKFIDAIKKRFPQLFLHWEDFGRANARRILKTYQNEICTFNDDIQGTGSVALAALIAAVKAQGAKLTDQQIVVFGAGTAGAGISDQICDALVREGLSEAEARKRFWLIDREGLLMEDSELTDGQRPFAHARADIEGWDVLNGVLDLETTVRNVKPSILIGCSAVPHAFNQDIIKCMAEHCKQPIIFPLSNPTERCEATPQDIYNWTHGTAMVATGSPFDRIQYNSHSLVIAQCNNALVFPGLGLGVIVSKAKHLTDNMIWAATQALVESAPILDDPHAPLLPSLEDAPECAKRIACATARQAVKDGVAQVSLADDLEAHMEARFWHPRYLPFKRLR